MKYLSIKTDPKTGRPLYCVQFDTQEEAGAYAPGRFVMSEEAYNAWAGGFTPVALVAPKPFKHPGFFLKLFRRIRAFFRG